jgi:Domain of unknown function (DUF4157)
VIGKASIDQRRAIQLHEDAGMRGAPGKRSLTDGFPVQLHEDAGSPGKGAASVHQAAQHGLTGGGGALPHQEAIQRSFGKHDVGGIGAHVGGPAAEACQTMGATAYATGDQVAFAGSPDLHTAAHEAAHVVQQRCGVQLKGGVGESGDTYERHADEVADLVVAGKSAESALDRHAGGGGGGKGAVQHKLIVGGKTIRQEDVDPELVRAFSTNVITEPEMNNALARLQAEAGDKRDFNYPDWLTAAQGLVTHDAESLGSLALHSGTVTFTNANKKFAPRAQQLIDLIAAHPSIGAFINNRPCFITLVNSPGNPASVIDLGKQVNIELAYWYFETYELGYTLGMLCHEFAVHPMADGDPRVQAIEPNMMGQDIPTGVKDGKKDHTINSDSAGQVDHVFAAVVGMPRHDIYVRTVVQMAELLAAEAAKHGTGIGIEEVTNLLDCFMMDCASILATNDHRDKGAQVPGLVAACYNDYLAQLPSYTKDKAVLGQMPAPKTRWGVASGYFTVVGRLAKGQLSDASRERTAYQPTDLQRTFLENHPARPRLHWIEPDGRCVFGALGHQLGIPAQAVILMVIGMLEQGHPGLTTLVTNAGLTVQQVLNCIRRGRWAEPHVGDIILELGATALGLGVTVLNPDGTTLDINGGGNIIIRVTSPLEHYHATSQ